MRNEVPLERARARRARRSWRDSPRDSRCGAAARRRASCSRGRADRGPPRQRGRGDPGGFTLALDGEPPLLRRIEPPGGTRVRAGGPDHALGTTESRKLARPQVPRADAVYSLQRTALLVDVLATGARRASAGARRPAPPARPRDADAAVLPHPAQHLPASARSAHALGRRPEHAAVGARASRPSEIAARSRRWRPTPSCSALAPEPRGVLVT